MHFGLNNAPTVFSRIVIATFCDFIHRFIEVYMDDWTMYNLLKEHIGLLQLMFNHCRQPHISLYLKKCIFCVPFRNLLRHIVCREGVLVDLAKVVVIPNMPPPTTAKQFQSMLGYTWYYCKFIKSYASISAPLEKLLNEAKAFSWMPKCNQAFDTLKENLSIAPILVCLNW